MNNQKLAISIISISAIILLGVIYFIFVHKYSSTTQTNNQIATSTQNTNKPNQTNQKINIEQPKAKIESDNKIIKVSEEDEVKKMAGLFAERFGSYSNQSDYANITNLQIFMTDSMKGWSNKLISSLRKNNGAGYYGINSKSIVEEAKQFNKDQGAAEILVKTQRQETNDKGEVSTFYQNILVSYKKIGSEWRVDSAIWQNR